MYVATAEAIATETAVEKQAPVEETAQLDDTQAETGADEQAETIEETFSKADLEEAIKQREAEWKEAREAEQHEYQRTATETAIRQQAPRKLANLLKWTVEQFEKGTITPENALTQLNPVILKDLTDELFSAVNFKETEAITQHFEKHVSKNYPDWKPTQEVRRRFEAASKSADPDVRATARWEYMQAAADEKAVAKARADAGTKTQKATAVEKARVANGTPGPTRGTGATAPAQISSMNDADRAYNAGQITHEQYKAARTRFGVK